VVLPQLLRAVLGLFGEISDVTYPNTHAVANALLAALVPVVRPSLFVETLSG
jgi:hypothetical protein